MTKRAKLTTVEKAVLRDAADDGVFNPELRGKRFSLTGTMSMDRSDIVEVIKLAGGTYDEKPRAGTHFLIVGDTKAHGMTDKINKALAMGIEILEEPEFAQRLWAEEIPSLP